MLSEGVPVRSDMVVGLSRLGVANLAPLPFPMKALNEVDAAVVAGRM